MSHHENPQPLPGRDPGAWDDALCRFEDVLARPFAEPAQVRRSRAHVEMMALEVEVLTQRLQDPQTPPELAERAVIRLDELAGQLARVRGDL